MSDDRTVQLSREERDALERLWLGLWVVELEEPVAGDPKDAKESLDALLDVVTRWDMER